MSRKKNSISETFQRETRYLKKKLEPITTDRIRHGHNVHSFRTLKFRGIPNLILETRGFKESSKKL